MWKSGGHVHPDRWTYDRPQYRGGWTLRGGERLEAPIVSGGDRLKVTANVEYVRNTPAPIALVFRASIRAAWSSGWQPGRPANRGYGRKFRWVRSSGARR